MNKFTNPYLGVLILKRPSRHFSHLPTIVRRGRAHCALESKMGNKKSEKATSRTAAKFKARLAAAAAQAKPSKAAGRAETKEAFNNYMERVIGKTFIILSTLDSIHP